MKVFSWNVNGLRAVLQKGFRDVLEESGADVFCVQETKARREQVPGTFDGWHLFMNSAVRPGYSGTAIFAREAPDDVRMGIGEAEHDAEGRVVTAEWPGVIVVNVYTPNVGRELGRLPYRVDAWGPAFRRYLAGLLARKPVIVCGDMNVARHEIDLARPKQNVGNAGFTNEERADFERFLDLGFADSFRQIEKGGGHYTWWSYQNQARPRNIGWRIDYACLSSGLLGRLRSAEIHPGTGGSDHCPVSVEVDWPSTK